MPEPVVQHESVLLTGSWRITSFGKLTSNPAASRGDLRINVHLTPLTAPSEGDSSARQDGPNIRCLQLPIGELPRLYLNAVVQDGVLAKNSAGLLRLEETSGRSVDCSRSNIQVFRRREIDVNGRYIIPVRENWEHQASTTAEQSLFIAIGSKEDPYATIIPAVEVFRFFYATSDVLTKAAIHGHFLDPDTHLWSINRSAMTSDGKAVLWLRRRMLDADARFLARFAFDAYALKQAQQVYLSAAAAMNLGYERLIYALPPFEGPCNIKFLCIDLSAHAPGRVLITRLLTCDWAPPFSELAYDRDNDGRPVEENREERPPVDYQPTFYDAPSDRSDDSTIVLSKTAPSKYCPPTNLRESEITERFPELARIDAQKLPQEGARARSKSKDWKPIMKEAYKGSVVEGSSSGDYIGKTVIEGLEARPEKDSKSVNDIDPTVGQKGYLEVLNFLLTLKEKQLAAVQFLTVLEDICEQHGTTFNVFPEEFDEKRKAWLYVDDKRNFRRMVLVAEVTTGDRIRHIIELQERKQIGCSTLVAWNKNERSIPPSFLSVLVMDCAKEEGTTLSSAERLNIAWKRLHHTHDEDISEGAENFLTRVFSDRILAN